MSFKLSAQRRQDLVELSGFVVSIGLYLALLAGIIAAPLFVG